MFCVPEYKVSFHQINRTYMLIMCLFRREGGREREQRGVTLITSLKFIPAHLILLCFALLHFTDTAGFWFCSLQIEDLWQPCIAQIYWHHFSNSICLFSVSVSHLVNSLNISDFHYYIMVICDL